ncbi:unnamed protein product [Clonostachys chloroleuca]|uniref:Lariat debranching enzyme C-terminal domain-containing protein n=1 Tax=Clonostachys chloroleuca TaxID=1926264 RepID=A0AA35QF70_9HYPO|nr:unnamed protein product [Clonostachys chloroleuca]
MESPNQPTPKPRIAVVGCGHGQLDTIYADLESACSSRGWSLSDIDLLIICGDFQAVRNESDLNCMSVPRRYRQLGDFHKYYSKQIRAPVLTIVIGGNHEASNYFFELYHGGWLAPNIFYMGAAGVIRYGPWRIAGLSGIYGRPDYRSPHHERLPYDRDGIKSVYHVREYDVEKLLRVTGHVDIGLTHDWPAWVELCGEYESLYAAKPHFLASAKIDNLGSKPASRLLGYLQPSYWFSGHMHVKFSASINHVGSSFEDTVRLLPVSESFRTALPLFKKNASESVVENTSITKQNNVTQFLALSKAAGDHPSTYMELLELELPERSEEEQQYFFRDENGKYHLSYDEEWLAITRAYNDTLRFADPNTLIVPPAKKKSMVSPTTITRHMTWVRENISKKGLLRIPEDFTAHAPTQSANTIDGQEQPPEFPNKQTSNFAELLEMEDKFAVSVDDSHQDDDGGGIEFGWE